MEFISSSEDSGRFWVPELSGTDATALLDQFFDSPNVGFAIYDDHLRYAYLNEALARMHGMPVAAHIGRTVYDILGEAGPTVATAVREVLSTGQAVSNLEVIAKFPARAETGYWVGNCFPIEDASGRVTQVGGMIVELVGCRKLEGRLTERVLRTEAFLEASISLMSTLDEKQLAPAIADFVGKVVRNDFASIALYDRSIHRLHVYALGSPLPQELTGSGTVVPVTEPPYGPTFLHGEARFHNRDQMAASDSQFLRQLLNAGIQSVCFLPLIGRKKGMLGTLNLGRKAADGFDPQDAAFLTQVAAQVALALDNAAVYREIEELTDKLNKEKLYLQEEVRSNHNFEDLIGESPALQRVLGQLHTVAPSDATVLVLGETGTGKELIARAIHRLSSRKDANFIKLNCAAIPTGLLESELFGHEKGAFTGAISQKIGRLELADKGTLFLDEVGEIPLELQPKLLRVLQDQEFERLGSTRTIKVNIRLIAATNRDLAKSVSKHEFRSDLFYRLHVFPLRLPPLRERGKDIPLLVRYFVQKFAKRMNKQIETIPAEAMHALQSWAWPGNVRELENFIERSVILSPGPMLSVPLAELRAEHESPLPNATLETLEREHILRVLRETGGVIAGLHGAAARLGMKRTTLQSRMQKLGITRGEYQN